MAYRLDPAQPTPTELRRVLREQLDAAASLLRDTDVPSADALHEVRTHVKKARSLLRLARGDLGAGVARHANAELRAVNRGLAAARDSDSLGECLDRLVSVAVDDTERDALAEVREAVVVPSGLPALTRGRAHGAATVLVRTISWIEQVPPRAEGWPALAEGFGRGYRRGRRRLARLPADPTAAELHDWRKRVKDLWYHQRLLRDLWPAAQRPVRRAAKTLSAALGEDHDLAELRTRLRRGDRAVPPTARDLVVSIVDAERLRLQVEARELGGRLYAEEPAAWDRSARCLVGAPPNVA